MSIDVSDALRNEGVPYPFQEELALGVIAYDAGDIKTCGKTKLAGTLTAMDGEIFVEGQIQVTLSRICDRCTKAYEREYVFLYQETFTRQPEDDESENYAFSNDEVDFKRMAEDCIVLQAPTASLCSEDCKGLCPICGADLNLARCDCGNLDQIGPFGVLAGFVDRDKED